MSTCVSPRCIKKQELVQTMVTNVKKSALATLATLALVATSVSAFKWSYCDDFDNKIVLHEVDLSPSPLKGGAPMKFKLNATLPFDIKEDAYIKGEAKYLFIKVPIPKTELCDHTTCPVKKGDIHVEETEVIPDNYPEGTYNVRLEAYNSPDEPLLCVNAEVELD